MALLKNNKLKIGLLSVLLISILLSIWSIWNYHGSSTSFTNHMPQQGFMKGGDHSQSPNQSSQPPSQNNFSPPQQSGGNAPSQENMPTRPNGVGMGIGNSDKKYADGLALYGVGFFCLAVTAYFLLIRKKIKIGQNNKRIVIWSLLGIGLFLRIAVAPYAGGDMDLSLFENWATTAAKSLTGFYTNGNSDYPPLFIYVLYLAGKVASLPSMGSYLALFVKVPSILADVATAYIIYRIGIRNLSPEISLLIAVFYIFNPAILINSTFWGQVDSFFTLLVVLGVYLLQEKKCYGAVVFFTFSVLMKPQGIIFLPVLFFELVRLKKVKYFLGAAGTALLTAVVIIMPFSLHQGPFWIIKLFTNTVGEYPFASVNAFNLFSLLGANYTQDSITLFIFSYHTWGMIFIILVTAFTWLIYIKGRNSQFAFVTALIQIAGVFTLSSSMHERYLFPAAALSLLAFIYLKDKRLLWLSAGYSMTIFINTFAVLYGAYNGMQSTPNSTALFITSFLNVVFFIYLLKVVWDITVKSKLLNLKVNSVE